MGRHVSVLNSEDVPTSGVAIMRGSSVKASAMHSQKDSWSGLYSEVFCNI